MNKSIALLILGLAASTSAQNLLVNGGFEAPGLPNPGDALFLPNSSTAVPGWVSVDNVASDLNANNVCLRAPYFGNPASEGQHFIYLDNHSFPSSSLNGIYQDFATVPGQVYGVMFDAATEISYGTPGFLRVSAGSTLFRYTLPNLNAFPLPPSPPYTFTGWSTYSFTFIATSNTTRLRFADEGFQIGGASIQGNASPLLDNVRVFTPPTQEIMSGPITNAANGHIYYLLPQNTWTASEAEAVAIGGHLVTINDQAEQDWVYQTFSTFAGINRNLWIGLADQNNAGLFSWASGQPVGYTAWASGEPSFGLERWVNMTLPGHPHSGKWNNENNVSSFLDNGVPVPLNGVVEATPATHSHEFNYTNDSGTTITITRYTGPGGEVTIPSSINGLPVTKIGAALFSHSHVPVISVVIPKSVTSIAGSPFQGIGLSAITVDTLNSYFSSLDGVLFNKKGTELIQCPAGKAGHYTIPYGVQRIQYGAFASCTRLTSITISYNVYSIDAKAFEGCTRLTSITIPRNVTFIGSLAFGRCGTLTGVFFLGNAPSVGVRLFDEANNVTV